MAQPVIRVENGRELRAALKRAGIELQDLKDANTAVAEVVVAGSRQRAPRRTGRLAAGERAARAVARASVLDSVPYAAPIHWGWRARGIAAQPWVSEYAQESEPLWLGIITKALDELVEQVERSAP
jgi:hypothetical protein